MKSIYDVKTAGKFAPTQTFREKKSAASVGRIDRSMKKLNKGLAQMAKEREAHRNKKGA